MATNHLPLSGRSDSFAWGVGMPLEFKGFITLGQPGFREVGYEQVRPL